MAKPCAVVIGLRNVKVTILFVSLLVSPAVAEWLPVSEDDFSKIYMDPESKKSLRDGEMAIDALTDYDPSSAKAMSFGLAGKGLSEIERVIVSCSNRKYKSNGGSWFNEHMGKGATRSSYPPAQSWSDVPSFYAGLFTRVCLPH
jgi:hypothetical protein